jgi:hypothetical protein
MVKRITRKRLRGAESPAESPDNESLYKKMKRLNVERNPHGAVLLSRFPCCYDAATFAIESSPHVMASRRAKDLALREGNDERP